MCLQGPAVTQQTAFGRFSSAWEAVHSWACPAGAQTQVVWTAHKVGLFSSLLPAPSRGRALLAKLCPAGASLRGYVLVPGSVCKDRRLRAAKLSNIKYVDRQGVNNQNSAQEHSGSSSWESEPRLWPVLHTRVSFVAMWPEQSHRVLHSEGPHMWPKALFSSLKIVSNL